jgi:hypothetical protein
LQILFEGEVSGEFSGAEDVAYIIEDYGAAGEVTAPMQALIFPANYYDTFEGQLQEVDVAGKIVVLIDDNAPPWIASYLVNEKNAAGIIWIADQEAYLENSPMSVIPTHPPEIDLRRVPALRVGWHVGGRFVHLSSYPAEDGLESIEVGTARISVQLDSPELVGLNSVVTFRPGTDADLGDEIVLFYAFCDGLSVTLARDGDACPSAYMLELARLLNENLIDIRRPVMFVVWGGGEYGRDEFRQWIMNQDSYSITAPGMRLSPHVTIAIELVGKEEGADIVYTQGTSEDFVDILRSASRELNQPIREEEPSADLDWRPFPILEIPFQAQLQLNVRGDQAIQKKQGEALAFTLIRLVREDVLAGD